MSFWIYFWFYTFSMIIIWGFFIIAKIHTLKFKSYQPKMVKITYFTNLLMIILTILWYLFIFINSYWNDTHSLEKTSKSEWSIKQDISDFTDIKYEENIIRDDVWDNYY